MASRILNFEPAPLIERKDLPAELQPQNRWISQIRQISNFQEIREAKIKHNEAEKRPDLQLIKMDEENSQIGFGNLEVQPLSGEKRKNLNHPESDEESKIASETI
jgi:hypothetical protein